MTSEEIKPVNLTIAMLLLCGAIGQLQSLSVRLSYARRWRNLAAERGFVLPFPEAPYG